MAQEDRPLRLIPGARLPSTGMSTKPAPLFPVLVPSSKTPEENVKAIEPLAHVVEVKAPYALVHASPMGVAKIAELGLEVFPSKRGGEYYAVRIARGANVALVPPAPVSAPVVSAPVASPARRSAQVTPGVTHMVLKGADYVARETSPKRRMDVRRFEVRKDGELVSEPYVVSFQSEDGGEAQCSCPDWIYRRRQCKHIVGCQATFGAHKHGQQELAIAN
jgi:SWIM zinc finger